MEELPETICEDDLDSPCSSKRVECSLNLDVDSLINLDEGEDSKWVSESELEFKCFQDIPSPSSKSSLYEETLRILEHYDMSHVSNANEPLFWPSERKWDWSSWDGFCMSPRKDHKLLQVRTKRVVFGSESTTRKWKERSTDKGLSKSAKASMKVVPLETAEFLRIADEKLGFHIQNMVGLGEFDGHQGVDPGFNESDFMFL